MSSNSSKTQAQAQSKDRGGDGDAPAKKLPPPPCGTVAQPPLRRSRSLRRSLRKKEDDPFLIAYIECTKGGGRDDQKRAGALSKGTTHHDQAGFGIKKNLSRLSCKHSGNNVIDNSIVRVSQIRPSSKVSAKFLKNDQV